MKCRSVCVFCLITLCLLTSTVQSADRASNDSLLNNALNVWRGGDLASAEKLLSEIIENGTDDPRPLYLRGILAEQTGKDGTVDLKAAAKLEAETSTASLVNRAIERTQGPLRVRIERYRLEARNALKADPENERLKLVYRDALEARRSGDLKAAIELFREATAGGSDPRYFYMLGVTLAEAGENEEARESFVEGLKHEQTPEQSQLVSEALSGVQGEIRRMIEEQATIEVAGQKITRQSNLRLIRRQSLMTQDQRLADANAAKELEDAREEAEDAARRKAAADKILAENKARDAAAERMRQNAVAAAEKPAAPATADMPEEPTVAATEPMPADPNAPVNPFLTGGTGAGPAMAPKSSVTAGPIDTSYLPASTEYLMYVRPGDLLASGFAKPLTDMPEFQQAITKMSAETGFVPADIDSVTMGMGNLIATMIPLIGQGMAGGPPNPAALSKQLMGGENVMIVFRARKDIDIARLMALESSTEMTHEGKTYYLLRNADPNAPVMAMHAVDSKTFLLASEAGLKAAMTNGPGEAMNDQFAFVSRSSHMVQAFSSPLLAGMSAGIPDLPQDPTVPPQVAQLVAAIKGRISGGAIILDAGSDLALNIKLNLTEESAAEEANQALAGLVMMGKQLAPLAMGQAPPQLQPSLAQAVNSLASTSADSSVTVSITIPGAIMQVLKDNPELLGPMSGPTTPTQVTAVDPEMSFKAVQAARMLSECVEHLHTNEGDLSWINGSTSPNLSWRVYALMYPPNRYSMEIDGEDVLFSEMYQTGERWDSPGNQKYTKLPTSYVSEDVSDAHKTRLVLQKTDSNDRGESVVSVPGQGQTLYFKVIVVPPDQAVNWMEPDAAQFIAE